MFGTSHTVKKAVSSKSVELIYGSKSNMSRRTRGKKVPGKQGNFVSLHDRLSSFFSAII